MKRRSIRRRWIQSRSEIRYLCYLLYYKSTTLCYNSMFIDNFWSGCRFCFDFICEGTNFERFIKEVDRRKLFEIAWAFKLSYPKKILYKRSNWWWHQKLFKTKYYFNVKLKMLQRTEILEPILQMKINMKGDLWREI